MELGRYTIRRDWHFKAAHRLLHCGGEAGQLHNHTWSVSIYATSEAMDHRGLACVGDMSGIDEFIREFLDESIFVASEDHFIHRDADRFQAKHFVFPKNTTPEVVALVLFEICDEMGISVTKVEVEAGCTPGAAYERSWNRSDPADDGSNAV